MSEPGPTFRRATRQDVPAIARLLPDDDLGRTRELPGAGPDDLPAAYWRAFEAIDADSRDLLVQLTTDRRRPDALRLYESLGFRATHERLKLHLDL